MIKILLLINSILLIITSIGGLIYMLECNKLNKIINSIRYELQRVEGRLPHDQLRINKILNKLLPKD